MIAQLTSVVATVVAGALAFPAAVAKTETTDYVLTSGRTPVERGAASRYRPQELAALMVRSEALNRLNLGR